MYSNYDKDIKKFLELADAENKKRQKLKQSVIAKLAKIAGLTKEEVEALL